MENCVVCLKSDEDVLSRITLTSAEWIENKMRKIIEKHLWWWYLKTGENEYNRWVCRQCWKEISTFHNFYKKVEKAHKWYSPTICSLKQIKTEVEVFHDNSLSTEENLIDIKEVKAECDYTVTDDILENTVDVNIFDEKLYCDDLILRDDDKLQTDVLESKPLEWIKLRRSTNLKANAPYSRKLKSTAKEESFKYRIEKSDNFFQEHQHSLECTICNVILADFRSLKAHYRDVHNTRGYASCCGKKYFKRCLIIDHLKVHSDPNFFRCESCTKPFGTRRGLELHMDTHKVRERKYNCDECGKSYIKFHIYQRHKLTHVPDTEKKYNCSQCDKKYASDDLRRRHEDSTHARKNAKVCDVCGKSFSFTYSFIRHMKEHAGIPQSMVTCDICGVKLTNKYGLSRHIKMRHVEENLKEQICPYCSRVSPNLNAHRKHIKYSHTMQRNHACHLCDKAFRRPIELKEHLSSHTGEALYTCPHCPRTFISNANMHKHRKIAHRLLWEENRLNKLNKNDSKSSLFLLANNNKEIS